MKTILHLAQFLSYGSAKGIMAILRGQKQAGAKLRLLLAEARDGFFHHQDLLAELAHQEIAVDFVDSTFWRNQESFQRLKQKLQQCYRPEEYAFVSHGGLAALALSECNYPFVHICHGLGLERPEWIDEQDRKGIAAAQQVFAVSGDILEQLCRLGVSFAQIKQVYYPLVIRQQKKPAIQNVKKIGVVGNMVPLKGHKYALEAFSHLEPQTDCELHFFGDGPLRLELENLRQQLGLSPQRVLFHGFVATEQAFGNIDLLLQPSLKEGLGLTIVEAYEYGVGVCAFDAGGIGELVLHGQTGFLAPIANSVALAANIMQYKNNPALVNQHVNAGFKRIKTMFSVEQNTAILLADIRRGCRKNLLYELKK